MNNYIFTLNVGHDVKDKHDALTQAQIVECAHNILEFNGATIYTTTGFWQDSYETSTQITIAGLSIHDALLMYDKCPRIAEELEQCSVFATIAKATKCGEIPASANNSNAWRKAN